MKHTLITIVLACSATTAFAQPRAIYQQTQYKGQEIGKLTGDVYYARMDDYLSVFMVTPEGIVLVEPIGTEFATWLKGELASRFKVPVNEHGAGEVVGGGFGWCAKFESERALLASSVRTMPRAICAAMASARLLASVRYCASDCDETAVPPIATRPRMPSAKMRIATIASMRKKPRCTDVAARW